MPSYGQKSRAALATADPLLQRLFTEAIKHRDNSILEGYRGKELQNKYFSEGKTKLQWPFGNHNAQPSQAVDSVPYPLDWAKVNKEDRWAINEMCVYAGFVLGVAKMLGIEIRWGGDWDGDGELSDQQFHDLPHFELVKR